MESFDNFDLMDQYSKIELNQNLYKLKQKNFNNFLKESLNNSYNLYKKNNHCTISFNDYQEQLIKELEKQKNLNKSKINYKN